VRPRRPFSGLNPQQRAIVHEGLEIASTPILLVHGVADNHSIFAVLDRALRRRGFRNLSRFDYGLLTRDVRRCLLQRPGPSRGAQPERPNRPSRSACA
jgi:hypothetical protein